MRLENLSSPHSRRVRGVDPLMGSRTLPQSRLFLRRGKGHSPGLSSVGEPRGTCTSVPQPSLEPAPTQLHVARGARPVARASFRARGASPPQPVRSSPLCLLGEGGRRRRPVPQFQSPSPAQLQPPPPTSSPKEKGTRASTGVPAPVFPRNHEP